MGRDDVAELDITGGLAYFSTAGVLVVQPPEQPGGKWLIVYSSENVTEEAGFIKEIKDRDAKRAAGSAPQARATSVTPAAPLSRPQSEPDIAAWLQFADAAAQLGVSRPQSEPDIAACNHAAQEAATNAPHADVRMAIESMLTHNVVRQQGKISDEIIPATLGENLYRHLSNILVGRVAEDGFGYVVEMRGGELAYISAAGILGIRAPDLEGADWLVSYSSQNLMEHPEVKARHAGRAAGKALEILSATEPGKKPTVPCQEPGALTSEGKNAPLRPQRMGDMVGQREAVARLAIALDAARKRGDALGHILFEGPAGIGKRTLPEFARSYGRRYAA